MESNELGSYGMQWPGSGAEIITEEVYEDNGEDDVIEEEYLVGEEIIATNEINAISNTLDQSAAQNLIYMAQEGNMAMGDLIEEQVEQAENVDYNDQEYFECQVTEEVITDDWVQRQGEERIEIIIDSIESSQGQEANHSADPIDIDVPLPTDQDAYTASRPYPCDFCSRRFRKKANLNNHMVSHQQERPHACNLCGNRYIRKQDLLQHLKIHANPNYFEEDNFLDEPQQQQRPRIVKRPKTTGLGRGGLGKSKPNFDPLIADDVKLLCNVANQPPHDNYARQPLAERFPITDARKPFVCQQCGLSFAREKAMLSHAKNHGQDSGYECEQCGEMFWDLTLLREHEFTHTNAGEYEEDEGQAEAQPSSSSGRRVKQELSEDDGDFDDEDMDRHYEPPREGELAEEEDDDEDDVDYVAESEYGSYYCDHCGMAFHRVNLLRQHVKSHFKLANDSPSGPSSKDHVCNDCGESFADHVDLLAHAAEAHARYVPVKCLLCGEEAANDGELERHVLDTHQHELTPTSCRICGKHCRDTKSFQKHRWEHTAKSTRHACQVCHKMFQNKARLKRHLQSHRKKAVVCDICLAEFPDGRTLMNHRHSHTMGLSKKFPCKECGKSFGSRSSQQIHIRMHTGERPYGCRFCWKSFADGGTLRKHERIHTGEKPYGCVICPRAFNQRVVLREHIRSHHGSPDPNRAHTAAPYYCQLCHSSYYRSEDLVQDLIAHSDENTKRQRPIQVGPRKYKRRRKLKPHEIRRAQEEAEEGQEAKPEMGYSTNEDNLADSDAFTEEASPEPKHQPRVEAGSRKRTHNPDHFYHDSTAVYNEVEMMDVHDYAPVFSASVGRGKTRSGGGSSAAQKAAPEPTPTTSTRRPKMIYTEKARSDGKRKSTAAVSTTLVTRTSSGRITSTRQVTATSVVKKSSAVVAPVVIKDEFAPSKRQIEAPRSTIPTQIMETDPRDDKEGLALSSTELADVLVNKKNSDKFSLDIVNDLESILCSPIRSKVSESSATGPDFIPQGMVPNEVEVVEMDGEKTAPLARKSSRPTIIECRRQYLPSSSGEDRSKKQSYKPYVAKIASASIGGAGNAGAGVSPQKKVYTVQIMGSSRRAASKRTAKESCSTTEDEVETLDELMQREVTSSSRAKVQKKSNECEMCNKVFEDENALRIHVQSHF